MRYFDLAVLRSFLYIANGKSFAETASLMGRTASAISLQIKKLESDLGAKVFRRSAHKVMLTPDGERLVFHATQILLLNDEAIRAFLMGRNTKIDDERIVLADTHVWR
jgi:DNA-binding transcriptional LysR family regulator